MNKKTEPLIEASLQKLKCLLSQHGDLFCDLPPVLWFGNIKSIKEKILVISANPNNIDKPKNKPHIPSCKNWDGNICVIENLYNDYNNYFDNNPDTNWFGQGPGKKPYKTGRLENFLHCLNASFYKGKKYKYQAIHIDLLPFSTKKHFSNIANEIMAINGIPEFVNKHICELVKIINPVLIIINGDTNFKYFNQCVNMHTRPYKTYKPSKDAFVWIGDYNITNPLVIATNINMGSFSFYNIENIENIGKYVKDQVLKIMPKY